jgi:hypothetical protein
MEKLKLSISHQDSVLLTGLIKAHLMLVGMKKINGFELLFIAQLGEVNMQISKKTLFSKDSYDIKLDMASVYALFHLIRFTGIEDRVQLSHDEVNRLNILLSVLDRFLTPIITREAKQHFDTVHESIGWPCNNEQITLISEQLKVKNKEELLLDSQREFDFPLSKEPRKEDYGWVVADWLDNGEGGYWSSEEGELAYYNALGEQI